MNGKEIEEKHQLLTLLFEFQVYSNSNWSSQFFFSAEKFWPIIIITYFLTREFSSKQNTLLFLAFVGSNRIGPSFFDLSTFIDLHVTSRRHSFVHFTSLHFTSSLRFIIISIDDACKGVIIWACSSQAPATPKLSRRLRNNEQRWITWLLCCVIVSQSTVWMLQLSSWWLLRSVWFEDDRFHFLPCLLTYAFLLRSFVDLFDCLFVCLSTFLFL